MQGVNLAVVLPCNNSSWSFQSERRCLQCFASIGGGSTIDLPMLRDNLALRDTVLMGTDNPLPRRGGIQRAGRIPRSGM
jgi:hypothetical protein